MDGIRETEREAMVLIAALVIRLGGKVEINDYDLVDLQWRDLKWSHSPTKQVTTYEVVDEKKPQQEEELEA